MEKRIGKKDFILILVLLTGGLLVLGISRFYFGKQGDSVVVTVDGSTYGTYSLAKNQEIEITIQGIHTNTLSIQDGYAKMTYGDCPDKLCVHQKRISKSNETIICLPNKVVVLVDSEKESQFDSMVR